MRLRADGSPDDGPPGTNGIRLPPQPLVDMGGRILPPPPKHGGGEGLLCREMIMNARALDADIRRYFAKAEAAEPAELNAPLCGVHDRGLHVTHGGPLNLSNDR